MSQRNVEIIVGRLLTDETLRSRYREDPAAVVAELAGQGLQLTGVEIEALSCIDTSLAASLADSLDPRIQRAGAGGGRP